MSGSGTGSRDPSLSAEAERAYRRMNRGLVVVLLVCVGAVVMLIMSGSSDKKAFMAECQQHELAYRCTALWRSGETRVMPVPIVVPVHP
jgi:hypothetical protein